jgi:hypothetical protein
MRSLKPSPKRMFLNGCPYERVVPQRPMVMRKGNTVTKCFLYCNTKECLGTRCFWPKAGTCPTFNRLAAKVNGKNGNGKNGSTKKNYYGKVKTNGWVKNGKLRKL